MDQQKTDELILIASKLLKALINETNSSSRSDLEIEYPNSSKQLDSMYSWFQRNSPESLR